MKLAIMQPYFLPYVGYFQLMAAVDQSETFDIVLNYGAINGMADPQAALAEMTRVCRKGGSVLFLSPDIAYELMLASKGDCYYDARRMGVYRAHPGGIGSRQYTPEEYRQAARLLYEGIDELTEGRHRAKIRKKRLVDLACAGHLLALGRLRGAVRYFCRATRLDAAVFPTALVRRGKRWRQRVNLPRTSENRTSAKAPRS